MIKLVKDDIILVKNSRVGYTHEYFDLLIRKMLSPPLAEQLKEEIIKDHDENIGLNMTIQSIKDFIKVIKPNIVDSDTHDILSNIDELIKDEFFTRRSWVKTVTKNIKLEKMKSRLDEYLKDLYEGKCTFEYYRLKQIVENSSE